MSKRKTERLLGLVVCLLSTRRYLTAEQIRDAVPGYPEQDDLFKRMFERDKEDLRELGVPLETGVNHPFDDDPGYRIRQQAYELPELRLEADEAAVLGLAARVWRRAELAGAAAGALLKLRAAGIDADPRPGDEHSPVPQGIEPRLGTPEPAFGPLWEAVRDRRPVTFSYRAAGRSDPQRRELEPWGVVNRHGRWYVAGWDRGRNATRVFRLGRIAGPVKFCGPPGRVTVPDGADVRELVRDWDSAPAQEHTALLRVRTGAGVGLRRHAVSVQADDTAEGWDLVTTRFGDLGWFADYAAWFGPDAVVLDPPDLREAVIRRLKGVLGVSALVTSTERLQRLLALVPYVMSRKSVGLAETAAAFGVSERELVDDLNLLWCVELRAPDPYCPIDLSYEGGEIVVSQAESMGRPLRLAVDEASALLVALRMLAEVPGLEDRSALSRLIAKLEAAAGEAASASAQVAVQVDIPDEGAEGYAAQIRAALSAGRRLHLRYYVPGRDEATERDVDPMRLHIVEGRPYLEAWCLRAEGMRLFRLDRVLSLEVLDVPVRAAGRGPAGGRRPGPVPAVARRRAGGARAVRGGSLGGGVLPVRVGSGPGGRPAAGGAAHPGHRLGAAAGAAARRGRPGHLAAVAGGRYPRGRHRRSRELCRIIGRCTRGFACGNCVPPWTAV